MCNLKKYSIVITLTEENKKIQNCLKALSEQLCNLKKAVQIIIVQGKEKSNCKKECQGFLEEYQLEGSYLESQYTRLQEAKIDAIPYIEGAYTTFIYDTTIIESGALQKINDFLQERKYQEPIVTVSMKKDKKVKKYFFEKYQEENAICWIDIKSQPLYILRSLLGCFIRTEELRKHENCFQDMYGETLLVTKILSKNKQYPILQNASIQYSHDSIEFINIQEDAEIPELYKNIYENYYVPLLEYQKQEEEMGDYINNLIMCDVALKVSKKQAPDFLKEQKTWDEFQIMLGKVLQCFSNEVIKMQPSLLLSGYYKYYLIDNIKYQREHQWKCVYQKNDVVFFDEDNDIITYGKYAKIFLKDIKISNGCLQIKGSLGTVMLSSQYQLYVCYGEKREQVSNIEVKEDDIYSLGKRIHDIYSFYVEIPFENDFVFLENHNIPIWFEIIIGTSKVEPNFNISKLEAKQKVKYQHSMYTILDGFIFRRSQKKLEILRLDDENLSKLEMELVEKWKLWIEQGKLKEFDDLDRIKAYRSFYITNRKKMEKKKICLIAIEKEFPKQLIKERKKKGETPVLVVKDLNQKKRFGMGKVVLFGSKEHCQYTLAAKKLIAYHCKKELLNPFGADRVFYNGFITTEIESL